MGKLVKAGDTRYKALKKKIGDWMGDRLEIALALKEIRDDELYKDEHATFEDFCKDEYGISRGYAYKLIELGAVKHSISMSPMGDKVTNERQARALAAVPEKERVEVLEKVVESGAPVTAKSIEAAARPVITTCSLCRKAHDLTADCPKDEPVPTVENAPIERAPEPRAPVVAVEGESNEWWIVLPAEESAKLSEMMATFGFSADEILRLSLRMFAGMD